MKKIISVITAVMILGSCLFTVLPATVSAAEELSLTGLYNGENYTTHGQSNRYFTFDDDADSIVTTTGQIKAKLDYTRNMTDFETEVTIEGNSNGGIYAGYGIRMQNENFTSQTFNTPGYMLMVTRKDDSNTDMHMVTVFVRYMSSTGAKQAEVPVAKVNNFFPDDKSVQSVKIKLRVEGEKGYVEVINASDSSKTTGEVSFDLNKSGCTYYDKGALGLIVNGVHTYTGFTATSKGGVTAEELPKEQITLGSLYKIYGSVTTDENNFTTSTSSIARGYLKEKTVTDFSATAKMKVGDDGTLKSGIVFRTGMMGAGTDDMEGYSAMLYKTPGNTGSFSRVVIIVYKYGIVDGNYEYLGTVGSVANTTVLGYYGDSETAAAGQELTLHINVVGSTIEAYFEGNTNPSKPEDVLKSQTMSLELTSATDVEKKDTSILELGINYASGGIGFFTSKNSYINALDLTVGASKPLTGGGKEPAVYPGGTAAADTDRGSAVKGSATSVTGRESANIKVPNAEDIEEYSADFSNYTFYSSGTTHFQVEGNTVIADTTGTKRAMLDGVTVKGFNAVIDMKVTDEGTLRSGIVFRVNNIEDALSESGTLGSNDIEGYAAVLYKTPGSTNDHSRVVMCIYKYGIIKGKYTYLGTVSSKASSIPLKGNSAKITDAVGEELVFWVNLIDDELTAYFYNKNDPSLKSDTMTVNLNNITDVENGTPSMQGIHYSEGAIGLTATNYAVFTGIKISEPVYPSTDVGDLSLLDSYTVYSPGEGVTEKDGFFEANSSGTKKMIVNNLTVTDFKASVDMKIDENGNLKAGIIFRANEIGNGADAQTGWAAAVTRNYSTLGESNPNRIDIVLFKWGYLNGKLSYLGEVAREHYKSGTTFMDGKMAGEELTFVVEVKGAAIDATAYLKEDPDNKPITFSTNLKFAGDKEKDGAAYYESGSIGLFLANSVSDPVNHTLVRNFHIDDGSGVRVLSTAKSSTSAPASSAAPATGDNMPLASAVITFCMSAAAVSVFLFKKRRQSKH